MPGTSQTPDGRNILEREELIEQAYFFRTLRERLALNVPVQEILPTIRDEVLATTLLPMAIDFLYMELIHSGVMGSAMRRLGHYFTPFQSYVVTEAEDDEGRFDMRIGFEVLERDADYRASDEASQQGVFLYQFETLCRNRLRYDEGLAAIADDPLFDEGWRRWILTVRRQIGIIDLADLIYVRSEYYIEKSQSGDANREGKPVLFGSREGKISLANRRKDPLMLFAALQRQLGYPVVPRQKPVDETVDLVPQLLRRLERLEGRLKLVEDEQRGGIDISEFYQPPPPEAGDDV
jgi:hypothetical protein